MGVARSVLILRKIRQSGIGRAPVPYFINFEWSAQSLAAFHESLWFPQKRGGVSEFTV
jgi:hypothetical protein